MSKKFSGKVYKTITLDEGFKIIARRYLNTVKLCPKRTPGYRLFCFLFNGIKCVACGLVGEKFVYRRCEDGSTHFDLVAVRPSGGLVLMTRDHIIPKSLGGNDSLTNSQTMCSGCNSSKGSSIPFTRLEDRQLIWRDIGNVYRPVRAKRKRRCQRKLRQAEERASLAIVGTPEWEKAVMKLSNRRKVAAKLGVC